MKRESQIESLEELLRLRARKSHFLGDSWEKISVKQYFDQAQFEKEVNSIIKTEPFVALHGKELAEPGSFVTQSIANTPVLITRDDAGKAQAYLNVCRHRGAELVGEASGCRKRFSCPYHAWTYAANGDLLYVPHEESGFPGMDKENLGLFKLPTQEYAGWIWVILNSAIDIDIASYLGGLDKEFCSIGAEQHSIFQDDSFICNANWKLLIEGGIEAYHFKVAHRDTIAQFFENNLSSYQQFESHLRSVLPRSSLSELSEIPQSDWKINKYANVLYTLFPTSQFLIQEDHFVWIQLTPISAESTHVRLATVVSDQSNIEESQKHWSNNHDLTLATLKEDFAIGEGIQRGIQSGANRELNFGRFESALACFNNTVAERTKEHNK